MNQQDPVWSVSALNFEIKTLLEKGIGSIWIEGEISNFAQPASGHWYFSLKDETAQLRAAMFKNRNGRVQFLPENGQKVLIRAQVTLYQARGEFQVIVEHMEQAGVGQLMRQFEQLKQKLDAEGLFSQQHKQAIPRQAAHIGIITSASGAAIRDALSVIKRRSPATEVTIFPVAVQGEQAKGQIIRAIEQANQFAQCDVLLLIRGGGSIEDLWSFNEEEVARAILASTTPIVSGVGHEVDFTIADFVADERAPTPSVAAEMVTTDQYETMSQIDLLLARLQREMQHRISQQQQSLEKLNERLVTFHPRHQMLNLKQRLEHAQSRLALAGHSRLQLKQNEWRLCTESLKRNIPLSDIQRNSSQLRQLLQQHVVNMQHKLKLSHLQFSVQGKSLDNLSPLKTLSRGYAVVKKHGKVVSSAQHLHSEDEVDIQLKDGSVASRIL